MVSTVEEGKSSNSYVHFSGVSETTPQSRSSGNPVLSMFVPIDRAGILFFVFPLNTTISWCQLASKASFPILTSVSHILCCMPVCLPFCQFVYGRYTSTSGGYSRLVAI
jgi:hypothetical protein